MALNYANTAAGTPTEYYTATSLTLPGYPLSIGIWINAPSVSVEQWAFEVYPSGSTKSGSAVGTSASGSTARAHQSDDSGGTGTSSSGTISANTWTLLGADFVNNQNNRNVILGTGDGSPEITNGTSSLGTGVGAADGVFLGGRFRSTGNTEAYAGLQARAVLFDRNPSTAEWGMMDRGVHPLQLPGGIPYEIWEQLVTADAAPLVGLIRGLTLTATSTPNRADHAPILLWPGIGHNMPDLSAAATGRIMSSLAGAGGLAGEGGIAGQGGGLAA